MAEIDGGTWWWAIGGSAQLAAGLAAYRRGSGGSSTMMPFRAFGVASLFVGSASCAVAGALHASGVRQVSSLALHPLQMSKMPFPVQSRIRVFGQRTDSTRCPESERALRMARLLRLKNFHLGSQVDDLKRLGQSVRSKLGVPPRSSSNGGQAI